MRKGDEPMTFKTVEIHVATISAFMLVAVGSASACCKPQFKRSKPHINVGTIGKRYRGKVGKRYRAKSRTKASRSYNEWSAYAESYLKNGNMGH